VRIRIKIRIKLKIDSLGIWFNYKGDCIGWIWWWKRKESNNKKIYSTSFVSGFKNLQELDKEWENFNKALGGEVKSENSG